MTHDVVRVEVAAFTTTPGARYRLDGPFSGEEFRETILEPAFLRARASNLTLLVDLDGTHGYATSFLEEAFGGLARKYGTEDLVRLLKLKTEEQPGLVNEILAYVRNPLPE